MSHAETNEEMAELQQQMEEQRENRQQANSLAQQAAAERGAAEDGYWGMVGDPDVDRTELPDDHLEDFLSAELSDKFALGNITQSDWESWNWKIENEFWVIKNEFRQAESDLTDSDERIMYGAERPQMDNETARRLRNTMQVKKMMTSLSKNARGLRSGTEIHAVSKTESANEEDESGFFGSVKDKLV